MSLCGMITSCPSPASPARAGYSGGHSPPPEWGGSTTSPSTWPSTDQLSEPPVEKSGQAEQLFSPRNEQLTRYQLSSELELAELTFEKSLKEAQLCLYSLQNHTTDGVPPQSSYIFNVLKHLKEDYSSFEKKADEVCEHLWDDLQSLAKLIDRMEHFSDMLDDIKLTLLPMVWELCSKGLLMPFPDKIPGWIEENIVESGDTTATTPSECSVVPATTTPTKCSEATTLSPSTEWSDKTADHLQSVVYESGDVKILASKPLLYPEPDEVTNKTTTTTSQTTEFSESLPCETLESDDGDTTTPHKPTTTELSEASIPQSLPCESFKPGDSDATSTPHQTTTPHHQTTEFSEVTATLPTQGWSDDTTTDSSEAMIPQSLPCESLVSDDSDTTIPHKTTDTPHNMTATDDKLPEDTTLSTVLQTSEFSGHCSSQSSVENVMYDPGGTFDSSIFVSEQPSTSMEDKNLITYISLASFALKVTPQVPGNCADWGLLPTQVCPTIQPRSVSHDNICHVLYLSCDPLDSLQFFPTLFDPGATDNEFLAKSDSHHTTIYCGDILYNYEVVRVSLTESQIHLQTCFVFDPGGLISVDYFLAKIANIIFSFMKHSHIWTEGEGEEVCLN